MALTLSMTCLKQFQNIIHGVSCAGQNIPSPSRFSPRLFVSRPRLPVHWDAESKLTRHTGNADASVKGSRKLH